MKPSVLEQSLQAIEATDRRIIQLLTLRLQLATQLAQATAGEEAGLSLEERVAAVVSRLLRDNPGPLNQQRLAALFDAVIRLTEPHGNGLTARNGAAKKG